MKAHHTIILILLSIILINGSCVTHKKLTYLKYTEGTDQSVMSESNILQHVTPSAYKILPYDNLLIRVHTPDPQWSALFNLMPVSSGGLINEGSAGLFGYPVDQDGNIEIPFVGKVKSAGKTLSDLKVELDSIFKNYLKDAAITIKLVNNYVSILGEVRTPGRFLLSKDRINVFEAISMAGDLSEFSNRQEVQLIRPSQYGPRVKEFSLSDRSILSSEFYYVMPNDVIYIKPTSGRMYSHNTSIYTLLLNTITTALVIISYFKIL